MLFLSIVTERSESELPSQSINQSNMSTRDIAVTALTGTTRLNSTYGSRRRR